jgi:adenosylcobinamide-GDP ribazoletransferase
MRANACLLAIQFLSRLPVPQALNYESKALGKSVLCFPIVGVILGFLLYLLTFAQAIWGDLLTSVVLVVAWTLLTGGLHLDGLADTVDAWVGGYGDKEKTLRIMKDPAIGPMGSLAIMSILLLKIALVMQLLASQQSESLIIILFLARAQLSLLLVITPYAKPQGLGVAMQQHADASAIWGVQWLSILSVLWWNAPFVVVLLTSWALLIVYRHALLKRLQGTTGDTTGAWVELSEVILLLGLITITHG